MNEPDRSTELAQQRTDLALQRTIVAEDRTLMAWIRTSISMIGFGFSIYKFFQYLRESEHIVLKTRPHAARNLGLALIALGTLTLIVAALQHRAFLNRIGAREGKYMWSLSFIVALLMILVGVMAFVSILTGEGPF